MSEEQPDEPNFLDRLIRAPWHQQARCADQTDLMYDPERRTEAAHTCRGCPVRVNCLVDALVRHEPDGIWGGLDPVQRRQLEQADINEIRRLLRHYATQKSSGPIQ